MVVDGAGMCTKEHLPTLCTIISLCMVYYAVHVHDVAAQVQSLSTVIHVNMPDV